MIRLVRMDGDADSLAAVHQKDLSTPTGYLEVARVYRDAGRHDEALSWAEQGWSAFPDHYRIDELRILLGPV